MQRGIPQPTESKVQTTLIPPRNSRFRLLIVGALIEGKGQKDAVLAVAKLKEKNISAELLILGDGVIAYKEELRELVESCKLEDRVFFLGAVPDAVPFMQDADVVLVCSRNEAFGRVTVEAMLGGAVLIAADAGATQELVQDGVSGLLYRSGDPSDLAEKISCVYRDPKRAHDIAKEGQLRASTLFTSERYGREIIAVINAVAPSSMSLS